jgi:hypothetical protein
MQRAYVLLPGATQHGLAASEAGGLIPRMTKDTANVKRRRLSFSLGRLAMLFVAQLDRRRLPKLDKKIFKKKHNFLKKSHLFIFWDFKNIPWIGIKFKFKFLLNDPVDWYCPLKMFRGLVLPS